MTGAQVYLSPNVYSNAFRGLHVELKGCICKSCIGHSKIGIFTIDFTSRIMPSLAPCAISCRGNGGCTERCHNTGHSRHQRTCRRRGYQTALRSYHHKHFRGLGLGL